MRRFGDSRSYRQLEELFALYDENGQPDRLTKSYTPTDSNVKSLVRNEKKIFLGDAKSIKNRPPGFPIKKAKVVYSDKIEASETSIIKFSRY
ncbi:MAG: hypothetical protein PSV16_08810 [Flavobacterium sp.]|nr:hypothetical protein [Flavobacterium sp.]